MCGLYGSRSRERIQAAVDLGTRALEHRYRATNLGRRHITAIETTAEGLPLYGGYGARR
jgi:hypothetical protein